MIAPSIASNRVCGDDEDDAGYHVIVAKIAGKLRDDTRTQVEENQAAYHKQRSFEFIGRARSSDCLPTQVERDEAWNLAINMDRFKASRLITALPRPPSC